MGTDASGRVFRQAEVDSTNERALAALRSGEARHGDWHVARSQRAGRGRRGARWSDEPGLGLYATRVVRADAAVPPPVLTMAAGLAVLELVRGLGLERAHLKWPNDVLVGAAKLAGILVEAEGLDPGPAGYAVGIGLNVGQRAFPPDLVRDRPVTSLALEGLEVSPEAAFEGLRSAVGGRLDPLLDGAPDRLEALERDYVDATGLLGRRVTIARGRQAVEGVLRDLSLASGLHLETASGPEIVLLEHVTRLAALEGPEPGSGTGGAQ